MAITNEAKPTTSITNQTRIETGETWASIETTWATETRTWEQFASLLTNIARVSSSLTNIAKP